MKRIGISLLAISLLVLLGTISVSQVNAAVQVQITAPTDGFITLSPKLKLQGMATVPEGAKLDLVLVSVNGKTQKTDLKPDGSFETEIELEYFGENIVSATAITDAKQIGSARISVNLQRRVLFFDDFEGGKPRPEWAVASGTWTVVKDTQAGWVYTIAEQGWQENTFTYVVTPGSRQWRDYAVGVDVFNARGYTGQSNTGVVVRAQDDQNKVVLVVASDDSLCWRIIKDGQWSGCKGQVSPGFTDARYRLRVEVRGDTFIAYVNGIERTRWVDRDRQFTEGMPGLYLYYLYYKHHAFFDNFKVESLEARPQSAMAVAKVSPPTPDWGLIKTQLAQLEPRLQQLDSRLNIVQSTVGEMHKDWPKLQASVTPADLDALSHQVKGFQQLLQHWGQDRRVTTLQALLGEQMVKVKRWGGDVEQMKGEVQAAQARAESAEARAKSVDGEVQAAQARAKSAEAKAKSVEVEVQTAQARAESAEAKAKGVDGKATLGLILGAVGIGLALLVVLGIVGK